MIDPAETAKAEGIARTLAALARTLQEAMRLEEQARAQPQYSNNDVCHEISTNFGAGFRNAWKRLSPSRESEISQRP